MMGGALGLAVLASIAASRTSHLLASEHSRLAALDAGYHTAFLIGALFAVLAATLSAVFSRSEAPAGRRTRVRSPKRPSAGGASV